MGWAIYAATRPTRRRGQRAKPSLQYLARRKRRMAELGLEHGEKPMGPREQARVREERRLEAEQRSQRRQLEGEKRLEERQKRLIGERADVRAEVAGKKMTIKEAKAAADLRQRAGLVGAPAQTGFMQVVGPVPQPSQPTTGGFEAPAGVPAGLAEAMYRAGGLSGSGLLAEHHRRRTEARMARQAAKKEKAAATQKDIKAAARESEIASTILAKRPDLSQPEFEKLRTSAMTRGMTPAQLASEFDEQDKKAAAQQKKRIKLSSAKKARQVVSTLASFRHNPAAMRAMVADIQASIDDPSTPQEDIEELRAALKAARAKYGKQLAGTLRATPGAMKPSRLTGEYGVVPGEGIIGMGPGFGITR